MKTIPYPTIPTTRTNAGSHLFVDWRTPLRGLSLRPRSVFALIKIAGTDHNHVDYLASTYRPRHPRQGARLQWEHEIKWVEDDIPNHTFQYLLDEEKVDVEGGYKSVFVIDGLEMRNSTVNRGYVGTHWSPLRGFKPSQQHPATNSTASSRRNLPTARPPGSRGTKYLGYGK